VMFDFPCGVAARCDAGRNPGRAFFDLREPKALPLRLSML
jgi:hypothetical protein